MAGR
ncbi:hypothetical protein CP03DC29_0836A, partial [Chlamydia psittaci 03DC29]|jgi:hypothetical protein